MQAEALLQYLFDICMLQYVQSLYPDDGRKDRPKHVDCHSKIKLISDIDASGWFYYRNILHAWHYGRQICVHSSL